MNLYPNDLGQWISREIQQDRVQSPEGVSGGIQPNTVGGLTLVSIALFGLFWALHVPALIVMTGIVAGMAMAWYASLALRSLTTAESLQKPLSPNELRYVRQRAEDVLIQSYLDLAYSVVSLPATKDETANREVREAITALGIAVEALPPEQTVVTDNPAALRTDAQTQVVRAQEEADAVISASLRRRAESLLRRADTATRTLLLLRRNKALREEVGEQIKALGTSLTALQVGGRQSTPELSDLAASIHRVALEANAVTIARAEVDTLLSLPTTSVEETETQPVRLSIRG